MDTVTPDPENEHETCSEDPSLKVINILPIGRKAKGEISHIPADGKAAHIKQT